MGKAKSHLREIRF